MSERVNQIWCMEPLAFRRLSQMARAWDGKQPETKAAAPRRQKSVAILNLHGMIEPKSTLLGALFGGTSTEAFSEAFSSVMGDDRVGGIVIDVDSPGGVTYGVQELSDQIHAARGQGKPIIAVANPFAASAALWIASAADRLVVTPSGEAGSHGVFAAHVDVSGALEQAGVKETIVTAKDSPHKAEFADSRPLSDSAREHLQELVDDTMGQFTASLARNRGMSPQEVRDKFGGGRMLSARKAVQAGMADRIGTMADTVSQLAAGRVRLGKKASEDRWDYRRMRVNQLRANMY